MSVDPLPFLCSCGIEIRPLFTGRMQPLRHSIARGDRPGKENEMFHDKATRRQIKLARALVRAPCPSVRTSAAGRGISCIRRSRRPVHHRCWRSRQRCATTRWCATTMTSATCGRSSQTSDRRSSGATHGGDARSGSPPARRHRAKGCRRRQRSGHTGGEQRRVPESRPDGDLRSRAGRSRGSRTDRDRPATSRRRTT